MTANGSAAPAAVSSAGDHPDQPVPASGQAAQETTGLPMMLNAGRWPGHQQQADGAVGGLVR